MRPTPPRFTNVPIFRRRPVGAPVGAGGEAVINSSFMPHELRAHDPRAQYRKVAGW